MEVVKAYPPNIADIKAVFPQAMDPGVLFAYGDTIFSPSGLYVPPQLHAHECVHGHQQIVVGGPKTWWDLYLAKPDFRFEMELRAHQVEYASFIEFTKNRSLRRQYLRQVALRLSGPLYGGVVSFETAMHEITHFKA